MRFAIEEDNGVEITGWLVPDVSTTGQLRVVTRNTNVPVSADRARPDLFEAGIVASLHVGFVIDRSAIPALKSGDDIEVFDAHSGAPLYRRWQGENYIQRRLLLLDPVLAPQFALIKTLADRFSISCQRVERFSTETLSSLFKASRSSSIVFHGRPHVAPIASGLEATVDVRAALLRDPFEELAERLLFLRFLARTAPPELTEQLANGVEALIEIAHDLPVDDFKALVGTFRRLTSEQRRAIENPMVRMFGSVDGAATSPDDITRALEVLASFDVVGVRTHLAAFRAMLCHEIGYDIFHDQNSRNSEAVALLASSLARIGPAVDLLELDNTLYSEVSESIDATLTGRNTLVDRVI